MNMTATSTAEELKAAVKRLYPEIDEHDLDVDVIQDPETASFLVKLTRDSHELSTHLEPADVEQCLEGNACAHLSLQVARFLDQFCSHDESCDPVPDKDC